KGLNYLFKKQFFPEATIKSLAANQSIYEKGVMLFNNGQVKELSLNEGNRSVEFTIFDEQNQKTYLSFLKNGLAQKYSCNCTVFQKHSGACQHVITSMMYLNTINQDASYSLSQDRKSTRLNSSHVSISYAVFCLKKKNRNIDIQLCIN